MPRHHDIPDGALDALRNHVHGWTRGDQGFDRNDDAGDYHPHVLVFAKTSLLRHESQPDQAISDILDTADFGRENVRDSKRLQYHDDAASPYSRGAWLTVCSGRASQQIRSSAILSVPRLLTEAAQ